MNTSGIHVSHADLGGRLDLPAARAPIVPEPEGELWHAPWEARAMALTVAMGASGQWNIDISRAARESLLGYLGLTYYEIWIHALERLLRERGLIGAGTPRAAVRVLKAADVASAIARGSPTERGSSASPRFAVGERVRTWAGEVPHHTRLPRYARGKVGTVTAHHGAHVFADAHATGRGEMPYHLYTVVFDGRDLWPGGGDRREAESMSVSIDAWEPYLEPA